LKSSAAATQLQCSLELPRFNTVHDAPSGQSDRVTKLRFG
jgi:hypothetical protein